MFNQTGGALRFTNWKVLGGASPMDYNTHRTLFAGPDPADPKRVLVRKLVQTSENVWCFEESRISASATEGAVPTVHTTLHRLGEMDVNEALSDEELQIRLGYRAMPNVIGFSLFLRAYENKNRGSLSIVENSLAKQGDRWSTWFRDLQDKRDISAYLKMRWLMN